LVTHNRPHFLAQAVESLRRQDYSNFEVILVDDGSSLPEAVVYLDQLEPEFRQRGWKIVRQENRYLGAARNTGVRHSSGEYLLFMDDDNIARPHELSTFVRVALHTGADVVATQMDFFNEVDDRGEPIPERRWLCAGVSDLAVGLSRNCFGDANALVRRTAFDAVGGFTEDHGVTHEDWEFMVKIVLHGLKLEITPEALFWYRVTPGSMIRTTPQYLNFNRHLRPYLEEVPEAYRNIIRLAQGLSLLQDDRDAPDRNAHVRPLRYEIADAINAKLKPLGFLHRWGRKLLAKLRRRKGGAS
jgi:glycosyltransferase involved in cell wall biosynthesis